MGVIGRKNKGPEPRERSNRRKLNVHVYDKRTIYPNRRVTRRGIRTLRGISDIANEDVERTKKTDKYRTAETARSRVVSHTCEDYRWRGRQLCGRGGGLRLRDKGEPGG